jgi:hypothetical protein
MAGRGRPRLPRVAAEEKSARRNTVLLTLKPETVKAFNMLKAEEGPRSGPRLAAEAMDLLLKKYGKPPVGWP